MRQIVSIHCVASSLQIMPISPEIEPMKLEGKDAPLANNAANKAKQMAQVVNNEAIVALDNFFGRPASRYYSMCPTKKSNICANVSLRSDKL